MSTDPYIFSLDPPLNAPPLNKRLGYRTPRSILLPPYMLLNQYWVDWMNGVDQVYQEVVDKPIDLLQNIRNMWLTNPTLEQKIQDNAVTPTTSKLVSMSEWSRPDRSLIIKQVNNLGLKLKSAGIISDVSYLAISRFVGQYWFEKGTQSFMEFINFCLGTDFTLERLWTNDYSTFLPEGSAGIGTPVWQGGTWYPTTHVAIVLQNGKGLGTLDPDTLVQFFYEVANYNLVLDSLESVYSMYITDDATFARNDAEVVAIALLADNQVVISNIASYGVTPPPSHNLLGLPTKVYTNDPTGTNYSTQFLLGQPSSWMFDQDGDLIPVYGVSAYSSVQTTQSVPTSTIGGASTTGIDTDPAGYTLIYGPVNLAPIPGSTNSSARIPTFSVQPVLRTSNNGQVTGQIMGASLSGLLVNPKGFKPLNGNTSQLVPYW